MEALVSELQISENLCHQLKIFILEHNSPEQRITFHSVKASYRN
jgi:hypothetical protein